MNLQIKILQHPVSPMRRWYLTSLSIPVTLTAKTINKLAESDIEEMLDIDCDASVTHSRMVGKI